MVKVLVTGGAGYIGSHVCKALAQHGVEPVAFDSLERGHEDLVRWGPLEIGDIRDGDRLDQVLATHRPEAVIHLAAYAYVGESMSDPTSYYHNNVGGSATLLGAMHRAAVAHLVFSSSCATFGLADDGRIREDHPQRPINPYGASKHMVERMLLDIDSAHGLRSVSLRYFNAAGADPEAEVGERHRPETHLIPLILDTAMGEREAVEVFGADYDTPDGTCIRDYIHVTDLAAAHVQALEYLQGGGASTALNLGTGTGCSVLEVIAASRRSTERDIPVRRRAPRPGDPPRLVAEPGRAAEVIGFRPQRSDLDTIVADAWRWRSGAGFARG